MTTWSKIEPHRDCLAPVDEPVLVVCDGRVRIGLYCFIDSDMPHMRWYEQCAGDPDIPLDDEPTHWMPLPALPDGVQR